MEATGRIAKGSHLALNVRNGLLHRMPWLQPFLWKSDHWTASTDLRKFALTLARLLILFPSWIRFYFRSADYCLLLQSVLVVFYSMNEGFCAPIVSISHLHLNRLLSFDFLHRFR